MGRSTAQHCEQARYCPAPLMTQCHHKTEEAMRTLPTGNHGQSMVNITMTQLRESIVDMGSSLEKVNTTSTQSGGKQTSHCHRPSSAPPKKNNVSIVRERGLETEFHYHLSHERKRKYHPSGMYPWSNHDTEATTTSLADSACPRIVWILIQDNIDREFASCGPK